MIKIEISNFQAIEHISFEVDGFSTILGRSNIGKSAITRAVHDALTGAVGTDSVRHSSKTCARILKDAKKCKCFSRVTIETPSLKFTWDKGDDVNTYTVVKDGKTDTYKGLQGTPLFLSPDFDPVKVGDSKELIQIPSQFTPIFLLNKSGPAVADVLSDVARLDQINGAIGLVNKDRKEAVSKRKVREEDVSTLNESLARYSGLDDVRTDTLEANLEKAQALEDKVSKLDGIISRATTITAALKDLEGITSISLPAAEASQLASMATNFNVASGFLSKLIEKLPAIKQLTGVDAIDLPSPTYGEALEQIYIHTSFLNRLTALEASVARLEGLDDVKLEGLETPSTSKLIQVDGIIVRIKACLEGQKALTESIAKADVELEAAIKALQELGVCPTCAQPFDSHRTELHLEAS